MTTKTEDRLALLELVENHQDTDFLRELAQFAAQRLMELEADAACGAKRYERSEERVNQRSGYRPRSRETFTGQPPSQPRQSGPSVPARSLPGPGPDVQGSAGLQRLQRLQRD